VIEGFDSGDGWESLRFMVWDPETKKKCVEGKYELSCAYVPTGTDGQPGLWHNCKYDEKILTGEYTHVAVVPNPRYEGAVIELANSLKKGGIVNRALKAVLSLVPVAELKEIVNSIESDQEETKKIDAAKNAEPMKDEPKANADEPKKDEPKENASNLKQGDEVECDPDGDGEVVEVHGSSVLVEFSSGERKMFPISKVEKTNAAPPDPAVEGAAVLTKENQPEAGTEAASPEGKAKAKANDGDIPAVRPEPGVAGAVIPEPVPAANADEPKPEDKPKANADEPKPEDKPKANAEPKPEDKPKANAEPKPEDKPKANADEPKPEEKPLVAKNSVFSFADAQGEVMEVEALDEAAAWRQLSSDTATPEVELKTMGLKVSIKNSAIDPAKKATPEMANSVKARVADARRQEKLNALKKLALKNSVAREALRKQYFEDLRNAAELRGGRPGSCQLGVTTPDDKQDLGRARYGS